MILKGIYNFYFDGFKKMSQLSKRLWLIVIIKLIIIFVLLKLVFFRDFLSSKFETEEEKTEYVLNQLSNFN